MSRLIAGVGAREILDSRGRPTLEVTVSFTTGASGRAAVPSGASTGALEAVELRDHDANRYAGAGVLSAVANVRGEIRDALMSKRFADLADLDATLVELDGTEGRRRLGANALCGVSMASARAFAALAELPLYRSLARAGDGFLLPVPHFNVLNGGAHADNELDFQEFMVAPIGAPGMAEAVRAGAEIYGALRARLDRQGLSTGLGDEGGFAPQVATPEEALTLLTGAIEEAGYVASRDSVAIALDPAASQFRQPAGTYRVAGQEMSADDLIDRYDEMLTRFAIWSIEDGLGEDDWSGWRRMTERLGGRAQIVGDDIFVTNAELVRRGIKEGVANAVLLKVNQIGTVTETLATAELCNGAGYRQMVSHRSGETPDTFIADLATAIGCGQLKSGAPARGERVAKYNRLMEIEADDQLPYGLA